MTTQSIMEQIEGYDKIREEQKVLQKYGQIKPEVIEEVAHVIDKLHPASLDLKITQIKEVSPSAKTIRMVAPDRSLPPFQAGQYINLFMDVDGVRTSRPYSISSPPSQTAYYDITVRRVPDGFVSNYLLECAKPGDIFKSTSPSGQFHHNPLFHGNDLVFIAGGSGITPFMSMIREISNKGLNRKVCLIYGNRISQDIIFKDEMRMLAEQNDNLSIHTVISEPDEDYTGLTGFITVDLIQNLCGDIGGKTFYLCGPEAMYSFVLAELEKLHIPKRKIRVEVFGPPSDITQQPGWPEGIGADTAFNIRIRAKQTITAVAGEPLMNSLERAGITMETASCRSGECSLCRTRLISGKVYQPNSVKLRVSDRRFGYIHPCMTYPVEDLELVL